MGTMTHDDARALDITNQQIAETVGWINIEVMFGDVLMGWPPGKYGLTAIPDYLHDATAALSLVDGHYFTLVAGRTTEDRPIWRATIAFSYEAKDENPALAICRAWLAYKREGV